MRGQLLAFFWAYGLGALASLVTWLALKDWVGGSFWVYLWLFTAYTTLAAWNDATKTFWRKMGYKKKAQIIKHDRNIKLGGSSVFETAVSRQERDRNMVMYDGFHLITEDNDTVHWDDIKTFINRSWSRQQLGKHPFSRNFWTKELRPSMPISHYNAIMDLLIAGGYILDRRAGKSGRLVAPGAAVISMLNSQVRIG